MTNLKQLNERRILFTEGGLIGDPKRDHKLKGLGDIKMTALPASADKVHDKRRELFKQLDDLTDRAKLRAINTVLFLAALRNVTGLEDEAGKPVTNFRKELQSVFLEPAEEGARGALDPCDPLIARDVAPYVQVPDHLHAVIDEIFDQWGKLDNFDLSRAEGKPKGSPSADTSNGAAPENGQKTEASSSSPKKDTKSSSAD